MAKFHGFVGFSTSVETAPGVWKEEITEREYTGELIRLAQNHNVSEHLNDDVVLNSRVKIAADQFAFTNLSSIKYAKFDGVSWKVTSIEHERPRLVLTLGGVYNGH